MSPHITRYTVKALSPLYQGSVVYIALTVTSCSCLVSEQMFSRQVKSKLLSRSAAVKCRLTKGFESTKLNFKGRVLTIISRLSGSLFEHWYHSNDSMVHIVLSLQSRLLTCMQQKKTPTKTIMSVCSINFVRRHFSDKFFRCFSPLQTYEK